MELKQKRLTRENLEKEILKAAAQNGYIQIKTFAWILNCTDRKIRNDIDKGRLAAIKMGPKGSKCQVRIPIDDAFEYISNFF